MSTIEIKRGTIDEVTSELIEEGVPYAIMLGDLAEDEMLQAIRMGGAKVIVLDANEAEVIADGISPKMLRALAAAAEAGCAVYLVVHEAPPATSFQIVADMNTAFGNPAGTPAWIDWERVRKQCLNIPDETGELFIALGADEDMVKAVVGAFKVALKDALAEGGEDVDLDGVRDALCDIHVFGYGAHHFMGIDADADMRAVVEGVMTRFIKDDEDKAATIALHAAKGVTDVYFEGEYPTMVMKSASDQPDAPKGKFLKSASFKQTVFPSVE